MPGQALPNTLQKSITTTAVEPDFRYPDQPFYIHLIDQKYVTILETVASARGLYTSNTEKWRYLVDAIHKGKSNFSQWKADLLTDWDLKQCWNGAYLHQSQSCPERPPVELPCIMMCP